MTQRSKRRNRALGSSTSDCNGSCCERFYLPWTPETVKELKDNIDSGEPNEYHEDTEMIVNMVIPLESDDSTGGWWYTCKHWDRDTRLCTVYEQRPYMCREYPYGDKCKFCNSKCGTKKREVLKAGKITDESIKERLNESKGN